jgi:hypothetical protein
MKYPIYIIITFFLLSCANEHYPGFSKKYSDLFYQRLELGDGLAYHPDSCFIDYTVVFNPINDADNLQKNSIKFAQLSPGFLNDSILINAKKGDHLKFITSRYKNYIEELCLNKNYSDTSIYLIDLSIDRVYNLYSKTQDPNIEEYKKLDHFFRFYSPKTGYQYYKGIWIKWLSPIDSLQGLLNKDIVLDYAGYSLEGEQWDIPDYAMKFNLKDQYQVIRGIEYALQKMHFGDSAEIIIPSYLAFGELGSKNGNIPPYQAMLYRLKAYAPEEYLLVNPPD